MHTSIHIYICIYIYICICINKYIYLTWAPARPPGRPHPTRPPVPGPCKVYVFVYGSIAFIKWILRRNGIKIQMAFEPHSLLVHLGPCMELQMWERDVPGKVLKFIFFSTFDPPSLPYQNMTLLLYTSDQNYKNCHQTQKWQAKDILEPRKEFKSCHLGTHWQPQRTGRAHTIEHQT